MSRTHQGTCKDCGCTFTKTGQNNPRCPDCKQEHSLEYHRNWANNWHYKRGRKPVGSGGLTGHGEANHMCKNGYGRLKNRLIHTYRELWRYCNSCGKDLLEATHYFWCIHHIDRNISNNSEDNLELLCKSCHHIKHLDTRFGGCSKGATTIPQGSSPQEGTKRPAPHSELEG